jgi:hypothetical protein
MKTAKLTLMFLACAAASTAFAQNSTDSRCGTTNFDRNQNTFSITHPTPGTANQQCFITVVPKTSWSGGVPNLASSQLVEGNYEIVLSGGGGAGGGGGSGGEAERDQTKGGSGGGGYGGSGAIPVTTVHYLTPGIYRLTIGAGGQGGASNGGRGGDGAPTSLSNATSGETVAGFSRAEYWGGTYPQYAQGGNSAGQGLTAMAYLPGTPAKTGERGADGGTSSSGKVAGEHGHHGGNGFIKLALKDPVPQAAQVQAAPMYAAPIQAAPAVSSSSQSITTPDSTATRPARKDRN